MPNVKGFAVHLPMVDLLVGFSVAPWQDTGSGTVGNLRLVLSTCFNTVNIWISKKNSKSAELINEIIP